MVEEVAAKLAGPAKAWRSIVEELIGKHGGAGEAERERVLEWIKVKCGPEAVGYALRRFEEVTAQREEEAESPELKAALDAVLARHRALVPMVAQPEAEEPKAAGALILSPGDPLVIARAFKEARGQIDLGEGRGPEQVVWRWNGEFWGWNGSYYQRVGKEEMVKGVYLFLDEAKKKVKDQDQEYFGRFRPNRKSVGEVLEALKVVLAFRREEEINPPRWLDVEGPEGDAKEWVAFKNAVVNLRTGEWFAPTPQLWTTSGLDFEWDPEAQAPRWERFLEEVWPDDSQAQEFGEEWLGYCMTAETRLQKGTIFIGPKRSGKGTICGVMGKLVGAGGYVGLNIHDWVKTENSREVLIGKKVGVFGDVRLKPAKQYGAVGYDAGGIDHRSAELLLQIIGEDRVSVGRKFIGPWEGVLPVRFTFVSNEVPNLNEGGGVLPSRFVKLKFGQSFFDKEDVRLRETLEAELPGIAARCVAAYRRLCARGRFVQPDSAAGLEREILAKSDAFAEMALDCFEPDHAGYVSKEGAYGRFVGWCEDNGRMDLKRAVPDNRFGRRLAEVPGFEHLNVERAYRPLGQGGRQGPRCWLGIRLKPRD